MLRIVFVCLTCKHWNDEHFKEFSFGSGVYRRMTTFENLKELLNHQNDNIDHTINVELDDY